MHIPVLTEKILEYLNPQPNENFVDCTAGGGGHTLAILERTTPKGKVLAIDLDPSAIQLLKTSLSARSREARQIQNRLVLREGNFANIKEIARQEKFPPAHGILFDLGLSSDQLESRGRGFSFQKDEPLDMRYSQSNPISAEKILNYSSKAELTQIFKEYGEEEFAEEIAQAIVQSRTQKHLQKTSQLVHIVEQATPKRYHRMRIHSATKTFQALRIAVNNELENLREGLRNSVELLGPNGKIAVISFHSLEDRIVKEFFKQEARLQPITKKPIMASFVEIKKNPRARSAKLRLAQKQ